MESTYLPVESAHPMKKIVAALLWVIMDMVGVKSLFNSVHPTSRDKTRVGRNEFGFRFIG